MNDEYEFVYMKNARDQDRQAGRQGMEKKTLGKARITHTCTLA